MKKILNIIFLVLLMLMTSGFTKMYNNKVLKVIEKEIPDDNFYFIRGLEKEKGFNTNVRYRGIVYSDKLKEAKSFMGIQVALEDMDYVEMYGDSFKRQYENALSSTKIIDIIRGNSKKVFGEDIVVYVDLSNAFFLKDGVEFVEKNIGNFVPDEKFTVPTYIDIFVDDITKVDIDDYKKKLFNLHQILYKKYNIDSNINMYLRDKKYLTYDIVKNNIFYIFKDEPQVKELLKKYKNNGTLKANEMGYLMNYFTTPFRNYDLPRLKIEMYYESMKNYNKINSYYVEGEDEK
nr:hypothetical protein [uncultured Fusobacterium sp.]